MLLQEEFNRFVENYNADYIYFLNRASSGNYNCLITSSRILKDLHDMVISLQQVTELDFQIIPYPFTLREGDEYYTQLGFNKEQITKIHGFLTFVKDFYGREFEECMEESHPLLCGK